MTNIGNALPDLSAITSVTGLRDATADPVIASLSTGSFVDSNTSNPVSSLLTGTPSSSRESATLVNLSDHAKQVLARAAVDQVVADQLKAQVQAAKSATSAANSNAQSSSRSVFDQIHDIGRELTLSSSAPDVSNPNAQAPASASDDVLAGIPVWQQQGSADNTAILQAGALLYNKPQALEDIAKNGGQFASPTEGHVVSDDVLFVFGVHLEIARNISDLQSKGLTAQAQALSEALQNGTLKFQQTSDVPDLNMKSWMIHFGDAGGGGELGSSSVKPTGATKAAIDSGKALALNMGDRGDFYVTW